MESLIIEKAHRIPQKKTIAFLDQSLGPGGAERVCCTVIKDLPPEKFDIHLILVSDRGEFSKFIPRHVKVHVLGIKNTRNALFSTILLMWRVRPDIVYTTTSRSAVLALLARMFCPNYKVFMRYPSMPQKDIQGQHISGWRLILMKALFCQADYVIAQTEEMAKELEIFLGIHKNRIHTIMNPLDTRFMDDCIANKNNPFDTTRFNVLAAGTLIPIKGFDVLIKAFAIVVQKNDRFLLHILGKDQNGNLNSLKSLANSLGISKFVKFYGFQPNPYQFYKHCDLFVLSSHQEALPNVLLECQYFGRPSVVTQCAPIISRLINHGMNGFIVEPDDTSQMANAILNFNKLSAAKRINIGNEIAELIIKSSFIACPS